MTLWVEGDALTPTNLNTKGPGVSGLTSLSNNTLSAQSGNTISAGTYIISGGTFSGGTIIVNGIIPQSGNTISSGTYFFQPPDPLSVHTLTVGSTSTISGVATIQPDSTNTGLVIIQSNSTKPALDIISNWSASAQTFTALKIGVTNTSSTSSSYMFVSVVSNKTMVTIDGWGRLSVHALASNGFQVNRESIDIPHFYVNISGNGEVGLGAPFLKYTTTDLQLNSPNHTVFQHTDATNLTDFSSSAVKVRTIAGSGNSSSVSNGEFLFVAVSATSAQLALRSGVTTYLFNADAALL